MILPRGDDGGKEGETTRLAARCTLASSLIWCRCPILASLVCADGALFAVPWDSPVRLSLEIFGFVMPPTSVSLVRC